MDPPPLSAATVAQTTTQHNYPDMLESSSSPPPPLPRSRIGETGYDEPLPAVPGSKLRLMCSYGGHIMPRPHDKSLCYVGGDTRIVVVDRHSSLRDLCSRLSRTILHGRPFTLKYQLPNEDLDNLITVTADEDLDNMIEEYDRLAAATASSAMKSPPSRLRVFLFFTKPEATVSMGSLLDESKSETWFVDALNNSGILSRRVSDSAAGDSILNLDGVPASGSSNNLEGQGGAESSTLLDSSSNINNNKVKNVAEVVITSPGSPMLENSSSSSSSQSPSMANLPPIRVRVDDNGASRLQQEKRIEEQFAQMTFGASGVKPDDGFVVSSAMAMPPIPASNVTMASAGVVPSGEYMNRVVSDDERSDHGAPVGSRKPPLPLQLVQPKTSAGGLSLPSPDSVASDSSIASTNSFSRAVYYQEQVPAAHVDNNKSHALPNAKSEMSDLVYGLQREQQIQESGYMLPPQMDQNQQLQQQQQQAFVHSSTHYMHHPTATGQVPVPSSYYQVYAQPPQQQQQQQLHQIGQNQYPVYVMPVGHTPPQYNMTLQANPNVVPQSAYTKDGTPPVYPAKATSPVASNQAFVQIPSNQYQQQYVNVNLPQYHPPQQQINVAPSGGANYGYEYGGPVQDQAYYTTTQQTSAPMLPQYQSMTPAAAAAALSDASKQFPGDNNVQQQNRTSQPV